jgi:hypothetical protein
MIVICFLRDVGLNGFKATSNEKRMKQMASQQNLPKQNTALTHNVEKNKWTAFK